MMGKFDNRGVLINETLLLETHLREAARRMRQFEDEGFSTTISYDGKFPTGVEVTRLPRGVVIIDTEYTTWDGALERGWSGSNEYREIVQIAAIRVDENFNEIESFELFVLPKINPKLSDFFTELTGITQEQIDNSHHGWPLSFVEALERLTTFVGVDPVICMNGDQNVLEENCDIHELSYPKVTFHRLRPFLENIGVDLTGLSSGDLHELTDKPLLGHTHNALHDVRSMANWLAYAKSQKIMTDVHDLPCDRMRYDPRSKLHRSLIRVEMVENTTAKVIVLSWNPDEIVEITEFPDALQSGDYMIGYINIGAENATDLRFVNLSILENNNEFE